MNRFNINILTNKDFSYVKEGNSVYYKAFNTVNCKTGFLKKNGCIKGISNDDLREMLGSMIFDIANVPHAQIELCIDDNNNHYAFSYSVLKKDEKHITINEPNSNNLDINNIYDSYFKLVERKLLYLKGISHSDINLIINRIKNIVFVNAVINNCDSKLANMDIIQNINSLKIIPPIAYDFGAAFTGINKTGIFNYLNREDIINIMFNNDYNIIKKTVENILNNLTNERIIQLLSQEYLKDLDTEYIKEDLNTIIKKIKILNDKKNKKEFLMNMKKILNKKQKVEVDEEEKIRHNL